MEGLYERFDKKLKIRRWNLPKAVEGGLPWSGDKGGSQQNSIIHRTVGYDNKLKSENTKDNNISKQNSDSPKKRGDISLQDSGKRLHNKLQQFDIQACGQGEDKIQEQEAGEDEYVVYVVIFGE